MAQFPDEGLLAAAQAPGRAVVSTLGPPPRAPALAGRVPHIAEDNHAIGRLAAGHLTRTGVRRFAYFGPADAQNSRDRRDAFVAAVEAAGFAVEPHEETEGLTAWLRGLRMPGAVFCFNDRAARLALDACGRFGLRVPEEIAVLGVDDDPLFTAFSSPPLSSIETGMHGVGSLAAEALHRMLASGERPPDPPPVGPVRLVERQSTDVLAIEDAEVAAAVRRIRADACRPGGLRVAEVVEGMPLTRRRLELRFAACLGETPASFIRHTRMTRAAELLTTTHLPVGEVAHRCGYTSQSRFGVEFLKTWKQTALQYRKHAARGAGLGSA